MTVDRSLHALRRRWWMVVACLLLGLAGAALATYAMPRQYSSDVTLYVTLQGRAESSDAAYQGSQLATERVVSYAPLLTDERITRAVIEELGMTVTPEELAERITVTVEPETVVLSAAVTDATPEGAAAIANASARQFVALVAELEEPIGPPPPPGLPGQAAPEPTQIGAEIIRPATARPEPVAPDIGLNLGLGAALGLLIGVGAVLVRDARDTSVRSAARLHELTAVPVLAQIAYDRHVPTRPLVVDEPYGSARAEDFRKLRTNLQFRDRDHEHGVFVVTGARSGEGTTTTACNLAAALAEAGNRVILLDANLRDPQVGDYLGLDPCPGLVNVLTGRMAWPYARQRWNRGALDVLPAGPTSHNPSQLLASHSMADLLGELRRHYDFVLVDTPALLPVSDAAAVAARADGVVLVVQYRRTSEEHVSGALETLDTVSARLVGTVLTMTRGRRGHGVSSYRAAGLPAPLMPAPTAPTGTTPASAPGAETPTETPAETTTPATSTAETPTAETPIPETPTPETTAPETAAPATSATETTAPETRTPVTTEPEATAPETTEPETTAPETTAPETTAPDTTRDGTREATHHAAPSPGAEAGPHAVAEPAGHNGSKGPTTRRPSPTPRS